MQHFVSSQFREDPVTGTDSDFSYSLAIPPDHNYISLRAAIIPKSYYSVVDGSNTFELNNVTYTLSEGYYTISDLRRSLNALLLGVCTINYSSLTGKMTFTSVTPAVHLIFPSTSRLYKLLGFAKESDNVFTGTTLVSTQVCNVNVTESIYVTCDAVRDDSFSTGFNNCISVFPANTTKDLSLITYDNVIPEVGGRPLALGPDRAAGTIHVRFRILNEDGETLDFNKHQCQLTLHTYKKEKDLYGLIKEMSNFFIHYVDEQRLGQNSNFYPQALQ